MRAMLHIKNQSLLRASGFIGGEWLGADDGATFAVDNPANGETIARVPDMGAAETRRAADAAAAALPDWRASAAKDRAAALLEWRRLILQNTEDLARLMTLEQGKPLAESRGEVHYGASFAEWFAEECKRSGGDIVPPVRANTQIRITREAAGVAALITPWNFPIAMIMRKAAPALAAGCTTRNQARVANAAVRNRAGGARRTSRNSARRLQLNYRRRPRRRRRTVRESSCARFVVYRFHRSRQIARRRLRARHKKTRAGTRRQCAVHRF